MISPGPKNLNYITIGGSTGGKKETFKEATANVTAASTITIPVAVPSGCKIVSTQVKPTTPLAAGELWDAALSGGSTAALGTGMAVNAELASFTTDITTAETNIAITKTGGGDFTAQGALRAIVYYETLVAMT